MLARHFGSVEKLRETAIKASDHSDDALVELTAIEGIGPIVAGSIIDFFGEAHNREELDALLDHVTPVAMDAVTTSSPVAGKTVVFTGALEKMTRDEAKAMAERLGAKADTHASAINFQPLASYNRLLQRELIFL